MNYSDGKTKDAALFVAEEFTEDIEKVTKLLFDQANSDTALTKNIETWVSKHPPITGDF